MTLKKSIEKSFKKTDSVTSSLESGPNFALAKIELFQISKRESIVQTNKTIEHIFDLNQLKRVAGSPFLMSGWKGWG